MKYKDPDYLKKYYQKNKEKFKKHDKKRYQENKEKIKRITNRIISL